jgi:uncharacterized SAM-binding protein YcdF (DUF218 family)
MTLAFVFVLVLASFLLGLFRRKFLALIFGILSIAFVFLFGTPWFGETLLAGLQTQEPLLTPIWQKRNTIVILGFGSTKLEKDNWYRTHPLGMTRVYEGARLIRDCQINPAHKCEILVSGGDPAGIGRSEADVMKQDLVQLGVNPDNVILEPNSKNTWENAKLSAVILQSLKPDSVVLVTSGTHLKRALKYFEKNGVLATGAPSDTLKTVKTLIPVAANFFIVDIAVHEYLGLFRSR